MHTLKRLYSNQKGPCTLHTRALLLWGTVLAASGKHEEPEGGGICGKLEQIEVVSNFVPVHF